MALLYSKLDRYWLWKEIRSNLGLSNPAYKYWKTPSLKLNNKYLFLQKNALPPRYAYVENALTDLSGHLPARYASDILHLDAHTFTSKKMTLYSQFEYKFVEDIRFVNMRRFFREHGIDIRRESLVQVGRISALDIAPTSTFYALNDYFGVVVDN